MSIIGILAMTQFQTQCYLCIVLISKIYYRSEARTEGNGKGSQTKEGR